MNALTIYIGPVNVVLLSLTYWPCWDFNIGTLVVEDSNSVTRCWWWWWWVLRRRWSSIPSRALPAVGWFWPGNNDDDDDDDDICGDGGGGKGGRGHETGRVERSHHPGCRRYRCTLWPPSVLQCTTKRTLAQCTTCCTLCPTSTIQCTTWELQTYQKLPN